MMRAQAEEPLDPRLKDYLELLRPVPPRNLVTAAQAKANYLAELHGLFEPDSPRHTGIIDSLADRIRSLSLPTWLPRNAYSLASIFIVIVILFSSWAGITARAAESALPGDTLYTFKTGMEQVRVSLAGNLDKQAGLYLEFASHRLQEIEKLVDSGRYQKAAALAVKFRLNIQKAVEITNQLAAVDPLRAAQRQEQIQAQLAIFTSHLDELMGKMPPAYQPVFEDAIPPSSAPGTRLTPAPDVTQQPKLGDAQELLKDENGHLQEPLDNQPEATPSGESENRLESEQRFEDASGSEGKTGDQQQLESDQGGSSEGEHEGEGEHSEQSTQGAAGSLRMFDNPIHLAD
jgi:hypothetical protein